MSEPSDRLDNLERGQREHAERLDRLEQLLRGQGGINDRLVAAIEHLEASYARMETVLTAIKDLLERGNGH